MSSTPDALYRQALAGSMAPLPGLEVVALPGQRLPAPPSGQEEDLVLVRVALGEPGLGCIAPLARGPVSTAQQLAAQGVAVEEGPAGGYAVLAEGEGHSGPPRARRITDARGFVLPGQLLLRVSGQALALEASLTEDERVEVDPFPVPYALALHSDEKVDKCADAASQHADVTHLCGAVACLTADPAFTPYRGHNDGDMLYVASLAKIYAMYAAFELRRRVELHAKSMIKKGLSTATPGWQRKVFAGLKAAWQPKLTATFPSLPVGFPDLADIFELSATGDVTLAERHPRLTDAEIDKIGEFDAPQGRFRDWMRSMLRWSNNSAASKCIHALSYPYINGALREAGFFDKATQKGLWLSGDYLGRDWLAQDAAGKQLSPRWARLQGRKVTNFGGTAFQVARLLTLLAQGSLVDSASSTEMTGLMTGAHGIGSYLRGALDRARPPRPFSALASKIGYGNDRFSHDCAVVRVERGRDPARTVTYVTVVLGSPPAKDRVDLRQLTVAYHDCIVARPPTTGRAG